MNLLSKKIKIKKEILFDAFFILSGFFIFLLSWSYLRDESISIFLIESISFVDQLGAFGAYIFEMVTLIGIEELFILFLFPILYWMGSKKAVVKSILALLFGVTVTFFIRYYLNLPGPHIPRLGISRPGSSFPSGHVVQFIMVFGVLFYHYQNRILKYFIVFYLLFLGFLRIATGYHFLDDVVFGVLLAAFLLLVFQNLFSFFSEKIDYIFYMWLSLLIGLPITIILFVGDFARHNILLFYFFGFLTGYLLSRGTDSFIEPSCCFERRFKFIAGIIITFPYLFGYLFVTRFLGMGPSFSFRYITFFIFGFFVTFAWPYIFDKLRKLINYLVLNQEKE